jgi:hypothetical protein
MGLFDIFKKNESIQPVKKVPQKEQKAILTIYCEVSSNHVGMITLLTAEELKGFKIFNNYYNEKVFLECKESLLMDMNLEHLQNACDFIKQNTDEIFQFEMLKELHFIAIPAARNFFEDYLQKDDTLDQNERKGTMALYLGKPARVGAYLGWSDTKLLELAREFYPNEDYFILSDTELLELAHLAKKASHKIK